MDGWAAGVLDRNGVRNLLLPPPAANRTAPSFAATQGAVTLDVVVGAVGRSNQGFLFDTKGLTSPDVFLDGARAALLPCKDFPRVCCFLPVSPESSRIYCCRKRWDKPDSCGDDACSSWRMRQWRALLGHGKRQE